MSSKGQSRFPGGPVLGSWLSWRESLPARAGSSPALQGGGHGWLLAEALGSYLSAQLNLTWETFPWRVCTCGARLMVLVVQVCKLLFCLQFTSHELGLPDPQEPMDHMRLYACWAPFVSVAKPMSGICIDVLAFCTHAPMVQLGFPL